jgi:hypothetical protein
MSDDDIVSAILGGIEDRQTMLRLLANLLKIQAVNELEEWDKCARDDAFWIVNYNQECGLESMQDAALRLIRALQNPPQIRKKGCCFFDTSRRSKGFSVSSTGLSLSILGHIIL